MDANEEGYINFRLFNIDNLVGSQFKKLEPVETILAKRSTTAIDTQLETGVCAVAYKK